MDNCLFQYQLNPVGLDLVFLSAATTNIEYDNGTADINHAVETNLIPYSPLKDACNALKWP